MSHHPFLTRIQFTVTLPHRGERAYSSSATVITSLQPLDTDFFQLGVDSSINKGFRFPPLYSLPGLF